MAGVVHSHRPRTAQEMGEQLKTWRLLLGLSAKQVSERAGINVATLSRLENGNPGINYSTFLEVIRSLGLAHSLENARDPWESDLGRARPRLRLPKRIREDQAAH